MEVKPYKLQLCLVFHQHFRFSYKFQKPIIPLCSVKYITCVKKLRQKKVWHKINCYLCDRWKQQVRKAHTDGNLQVLNFWRQTLSLIGIRFHFCEPHTWTHCVFSLPPLCRRAGGFLMKTSDGFQSTSWVCDGFCESGMSASQGWQGECF